MGKTTVVESFLNELRNSNAGYARGQCLEAYAGVKGPYYPVLEALGNLSRGPEADNLAEILETHAPTWLIQLPALLKREHRESLQRELAGTTRERMIREICEALEALTLERILVLLFEDLHWADHSTVDLISAIARRRTPAKLLVVGTYRPVDVVLVPGQTASVAVTVSWEPVDWGRRRHEIAEKRYSIEQSKTAEEDMRTKIIVEVDTKYRQMRRVHAQLRVAQLAQRTALEQLRIAKRGFSVEAVLLKEVLQVQTNLEQANNDYQQALAKFLAAQAEFEHALGEDL
jgi:hypothetical protein